MDTDVWLPIATLVGGAVLGYFGEWWRDRREYAREQERSRTERHRQSMLELIAAMNQLWMATTRLHDNIRDRQNETGGWDIAEDREFTEMMEGPILNCRTLMHLVENEDIRKLASDTIDSFAVSVLVDTKALADKHYRNGRSTHDDLMQRLGEYVRSL